MYLAIRVLDGFAVAQAARETYFSTTLVWMRGAVVSIHSVLLMILNHTKFKKDLDLCSYFDLVCFCLCMFLFYQILEFLV